MTTRHIRFLTALALAAGTARTVSAADSPWGIAVYGGDSIAENGELRAPMSSHPDLGALDPALSGVSGTLSLDRLRYDDLFRRRFDTGLELNYSFDGNLQSYGRFSYDSLGGRTRTIGAFTSAGLPGAPVRARFGDEDNKTFELGSRYLWTTGTAWRPYAGLALGVTRLDATRANLFIPDSGSEAQPVRFTRSGTVFSQSLETGVAYNPTPAFGVRFSVNADHFGTAPSANDPALASLGYDAGHDAEGRWSFPITLAAAYRFD